MSSDGGEGGGGAANDSLILNYQRSKIKNWQRVCSQQMIIKLDLHLYFRAADWCQLNELPVHYNQI